MLNEIQSLKIKIMCSGIEITDNAKKQLKHKYFISLSDFEHHSTTSGIILILPENVYVNASFRMNGKEEVKLDFINNVYKILFQEKEIDVQIIPLPSYIHEKTKNGFLYKKFVMIHADRIRVSPIIGCAFKCKYCDIHYSKYQKIPINILLQGIDMALNDKNIKSRHLLISGGTPFEKDKKYLDDTYFKILDFCNKKNIPVDIMLAPRKEKNFLKKLKEKGVHGLAVNLEIYNIDIAKKINPQKAAISRDFYFKFIKEAVKIFGKGRVRSLLIVGLEPLSETLAGVEKLAKLGCDVVLSPFIPYEETTLADYKAPNEQDLEIIYLKSSKIVNKYGVKLGPRCTPCQHNTLSFPFV